MARCEMAMKRDEMGARATSSGGSMILITCPNVIEYRDYIGLSPPTNYDKQYMGQAADLGK
jgi:hypothetical protein